MTLLVTIAFLLAVTGSFLMLSLSPFSFLEGLAAFVKPKNPSMKTRIERSRKNKQPRGLKLLFMETRETLRVTGKTGRFTALCILSMLLFVLGVMIALTMKNGYLVPVLAVGLCYEVESDVLRMLVYYILSLMSVNSPADSVLRAAFCHYPENYITLMEYYDPAEHGMEAYTRK